MVRGSPTAGSTRGQLSLGNLYTLRLGKGHAVSQRVSMCGLQVQKRPLLDAQLRGQEIVKGRIEGSASPPCLP